MTFLRRRINLKFELGEGSFGESGSNAVELEGLRVSANITKPGGVSLSSLELRVWGMTLSQMNQLSTLGKPIASVRKNTITVSAGDDEMGVGIAFIGTIMNAWCDMTGAPDACLVVSAMTGLIDAVKPIPPSSFKGAADVAVIMKSLANQMGYNLENSGVSVTLSNAYFSGTAMQQARAAAKAANIEMLVDGTTLAIWPKGGSRNGEIPLISKDTGMVGYPTHTQNGIAIKSLYLPTVIFGGQVQVESTLTPAAGLWTVFSVAHDLESELPGGAWFTRMECAKFGNPLPVK